MELKPRENATYPRWLSPGSRRVWCLGAAGLLLLALAGCATDTSERPRAYAPMTTVAYTCQNGERLQVRYFPQQGVAVLVRNGRTQELQETLVASGFTYEGDGVRLRGKAEELLVETPGREALSCTAAAPAVSLENTRWRLLSVDGVERVGPFEAQVPHAIFNPVNQRVTGFLGCNRFTGAYQQTGARLLIGPVASTRMACINHDGVERAFGAALDRVRAWSVEGDRLTLKDDAGRTVATLQADPPR